MCSSDLANLPVNGRQMSQLMLQAPGSQNAGTGTWQDIRFSGRAVEQNVIKYDGIEASAIIDSAPGNVNGENNTPFKLQASLENVQEFRVESSGYAAEFGTGTGGQVSVITKSGSNALRGSMFEYFRSDRLDARNYFDALRNADGTAAPWFAFVANVEATDGGATIIAGNERVLRARFADARHFWDLDRKTRLESLVDRKSTRLNSSHT